MKSLFFKISCIFLLTILPFNLLSQVKINVKIDDINDTILYLLKYKSDKSQIVINSSSISSEEKTFKNENSYDEGIYVLADSKQQPIFEILIGKDQTFSISVKELMDLNTYKIKGSKETADYFKVYSRTIHDNLHIKALESEIKYCRDNIKKIDSIANQLFDFQESMMHKNKKSFLNTYIRFIEKSPNQQKNDKEYIVSHYFDNLPLCDTRILNSHLLKNKLDDYFNNHIEEENPDVICKEIDNLLSKVSDCHTVRDYILWYLYSRYFNNDLVYIHLSDNYFSQLEINNLTENVRNEIVKRANILREITIGSTAPALSYIDDNKNAISLDKIDSNHVILFFYKPDCQKCIREKRILELVKKKAKDLTILSIDISENNYNNVSLDIINKYDITTTPTIYLLDQDKKIIAKHIKAEEVMFHIINK